MYKKLVKIGHAKNSKNFYAPKNAKKKLNKYWVSMQNICTYVYKHMYTHIYNPVKVYVISCGGTNVILIKSNGTFSAVYTTARL